MPPSRHVLFAQMPTRKAALPRARRSHEENQAFFSFCERTNARKWEMRSACVLEGFPSPPLCLQKVPCFASASGSRGKGRAGRGHERPWCLQRLLRVGCDTRKDKTPAKGRGWRRASKPRAPFGFLSVWGLSTPPHFSPRGSLPFPAALGGDFSSLLHLKKGVKG